MIIQTARIQALQVVMLLVCCWNTTAANTLLQRSLYPVLVCSENSSRTIAPHQPAQNGVILRGLRVFAGGNETSPPVILRFPQGNSSAFGQRQFSGQTQRAGMGNDAVTIEIDVQSGIMPAFIVQFVHCDALWHEDLNPVLSDPTIRLFITDVRQASLLSRHYTHRATFSVPSAENRQIQFKAAGNWKAVIYDADNQRIPLAEARFFVVDALVSSSLQMIADLYKPKIQGTSPASYLVEVAVSAPVQMIDQQLTTVVLYRNHRWSEPFIISEKPEYSSLNSRYSFSVSTSVSGTIAVQKRFRISGLPAENEYRVLDVSNATMFPPVSAAHTRIMPSDLRRNGVYFQFANDGALLTSGITASTDDYVPVEFALDPEGFPSSQELFVIGSFNNWRTSPEWRMNYNATQRLYTLQQWVRRGRHNYFYATGRINATTQNVENISFEECEGNVLSAGHTFFALMYYREPGYGGYDSLVGIATANAARR